MGDLQKIYEHIGNESFKDLMSGVINRDDYKDMPGYEEITDCFHELIERIEDENLRSEFEKIESQASTIIMYQGFVLGFKEAVKLILEDSGK